METRRGLVAGIGIASKRADAGCRTGRIQWRQGVVGMGSPPHRSSLGLTIAVYGGETAVPVVRVGPLRIRLSSLAAVEIVGSVHDL